MMRMPAEVQSLQWLDIQSPWMELPGRLRARCREGEALEEVRRSIGTGDSGRPYVLENESCRQLHFARLRPHSVMRLTDPTALVMAYTRKMMAFLLFVPRPGRILILGLGGGSLVKYCRHHLPGASIVVVESDADVIALREEFCVPPDDDRLRIVKQDWPDFLARCARPYDVVLVDQPESVVSLPTGSSAVLYRNLSRCLSPNGCLVMHLRGDGDRHAVLDELARDLSDAQLVPVPVQKSGDLLLFGLREPVLQSAPASMESAARRLQRVLELDIPEYLVRINECARGRELPSGSTSASS